MRFFAFARTTRIESLVGCARARRALRSIYTRTTFRQDSLKVVVRYALQVTQIEPSAMTWDSVASTKLADVLKPKSAGEPVNVHVVQSVREPQPDFAAMQRLIESGGHKAAEPKSGKKEASETFPRTADLPVQSPLFWVEQKDRYLRQLLIRDIEKLTSRRLVVYFANRYANAQIDARDCIYIAELFGDIKKEEPVDLLLETIGGATDATESLVSLLRNITDNFRVIVADSAKSNGTLLGLASKSIVMGAASELGPIEPLVQGIPC